MKHHHHHIQLFYYTGVGLPRCEVGSSRQALRPARQATLSPGSTSDSLFNLMSSCMHLIQVFFCPPGRLRWSTCSPLTWFIQPDDLWTCPYQRRRYSRRTTARSRIPSLARYAFEDSLSTSLMPQIQRIIARSFRMRRPLVSAVGAQVSLPCSMAPRTQELYIRPLVRSGRCREVSTGSSCLNLAQTVLYLVMAASSQPPPTHNMSPR